MKHFSLLRGFHVADLFTIANGCCGIVAVLARDALSRHAGSALDLRYGPADPACAIVFDVFDGRIARWRHRASPLGRELDSLADLISFGVAPAAIAYAVGLNTAARSGGARLLRSLRPEPLGAPQRHRREHGR